MNISSIAKASGVSVATVSRVLNNESGVSEELRRKTLAVIESKGYRPRENIRRGTRIAMVVPADAPSFENFFAQVFTGVSTYALEHGVETTLLYYTPGEKNESLTDLLRKKRCNGAILIAALDPEDGKALLAARIPTVLVANRSRLDGIGYVDCDCHRGALEQVEYLLRLGHRNIGFLCGSLEGVIDHQERLAAYKQAMDAAGIVPKPGWIVAHTPTPVTEQAGYDQTRQLLDKHPEITAIFANNDSMAYGAISACVELGMRVPEDISVVGYDDNPTSKFYNPPLTTTRQPLREMGEEAAQWVDMKLCNKLSILPQKVIHSDLIVRRSCALPRENR